MTPHFFPFFIVAGLALPFGAAIGQTASKIVYQGPEGCLYYQADEENNYIPDFSHAGYKNGEQEIPEVPVVKTIGPVAGDNTAHIQTALDELAELPLDQSGIRGALLLQAGLYEIHGTVVIRESGIILRGSGPGSDETTNTILTAVGNEPVERDVIRAGSAPGVNWTGEKPVSRSLVTNSFLPAGSRSLTVSNPERYQVGDNVIVFHPSTLPWLRSIDYGATNTDENWSPGQIDLYYNRYITDINLAENKIKLDAPIYDHMDRSLAQAIVYILDEPDIKRNIGIENLRIIIGTAGPFDEEHAKNAVRLIGVEDCWVSGVTAFYFSYAAVDMTVASRVTVRNCFGLQPHSLVEGGRRYNFAVGAKSNNILFENCYASFGRHSFVSNGASTVSGIVFHNCLSEGDYASSEGHRRWSQGILFDSLYFFRPLTGTLLGLYNRGSYGTGHGWSSTNSVAWHVKLPSSSKMVVQKPPGRQNYAIGCRGLITGDGPFLNVPGHIELSNQTPFIPSLYNAQLRERMDHGARPDAPARLTASPGETETAVLLNWLDIAARESGYIVEVSSDQGASFEPVDTLPPNTTSYSHHYVDLPGQKLIYRVSAYNDFCRSPFSNPVVADRPVPVKTVPIPGLRVYPNPASEEMYIESRPRLKTIYVVNPTGVRVLSYPVPAKQKPISISLKELQNGLYFLFLEDETGREGILKFVKY